MAALAGAKEFADVTRLAADDAERARRLIGKPRELTLRGVFAAIDAIGPLRTELADMLDAQGPGAIDDWAKRVAESDELLNVLFQSSMKAAMAGQLFVEDVELARKEVKLDAGDVEPTFLNLTFTEAVDRFVARRLMDPDAFDRMVDDERSTAWTMRLAVSEQVAALAKSKLDAAVAEGGTVRTFAQEMRDDTIALGFTPNSHGYLETVFRTSVASAYNAGRLTRQMAPGVREELPYWRYLTAEDDRVRDEHADLHGKVWKVGDPDALKVYPPNGYNCRCVMIVESAEDVAGETVQTEAPADATQEGFRAPPTVWT